MHHRARTMLALAVLVAIWTASVPSGGHVAQAATSTATATAATPRTTTAGTLTEREIGARIAHHCTRSSAEILAAVQGLGGTQQFTTVRHRGDFDATTPENSLFAFEESYVRCRSGIETDVRRTADGTLVMFHDTHVGKMLEPTYDPESGEGPNAALSSLTWEELRQKTLVTIDREPQRGQRVPSLDEFLDHYRRVNAESLVYLEIKNTTNDKHTSQQEVMDVVEQVAAFDRAHPQLRIFDRVVFKFRMSAFPQFADWSDRVRQVPGLPRIPLSQVQVSRQVARDLVADPSIPGAPGSSGGRTEHAVESWASADATVDGVLSVEVTMKDSTGYVDTRLRGDDPTVPLPFAGVEYYSPSPRSVAKPGTMARATQIVRDAGKPLGQFVPVPDWVLFRTAGSFSWDEVLPNVDAAHRATPVTPREAFFNNDSRCCYSLRDRVDTSTAADADPEQNDQRILLPWLEDIGATILTADDTDSIDAYFTQRGKKLDTGDNSLTPNRPDPAMSSVIFPGAPRLPSLMKLVTVEAVPRGSDLTWFVHGDAVVSETVPTTQSFHGAIHSRIGPTSTMAVYGDSRLTVSLLRSSLFDPDHIDAEAQLSASLPEHLADGSHTYAVAIGGGTVDVHVTVSRQWATASRIDVVLDRTDRSTIWGTVCGSAGTVPADERSCNANDRAGTMLAEVSSVSPQQMAPGDSLSMRRDRLTGARPLAISTALWGRGWDDHVVSMSTSRLDDAPWGQRSSRQAPGDHGLAVVHLVLLADGFRVPL